MEYNTKNNKIVFLGDTHFGIKNGSITFINYMMDFYENQLFPYLLENNIKHVVQLGDFMDKRKSVDFITLDTVKNRFLPFFKENNITFHELLGNHDVYYKTTNRINSIEGLFEDDMVIYNEPTEVSFDGTKFLIVPWITDDNQEDIQKAIDKTDAEYCLGHFELSGFEFAKGIMSQHGVNPTMLNGFEHVWTGHYHTASTKGNITYTGIPYELTWSDYGDKKGFYVFDTKTHKIEHIVNTKKMFVVIDFNQEIADEWHDNKCIDLEGRYNCFEGCSIKVTVADKKFESTVNDFIRWLDKEIKPTKIVSIDLYNVIEQAEITDTDVRVKSTIDLLYDSTKSHDNSDELNLIIKELYESALLEGMNEE